MKSERFSLWMHAVDDGLLEEARRPVKKRRVWLRAAAAAAACLCIVTAGVLILRRQSPGTAQIANPVRSATEAELTALGYSIPLPEGAQDAQYSLISGGGGNAAPLAQATFSINERQYTCRALKTQAQQDISGIYETWSVSLDWSIGTLEMQLRQTDGSAWVGWFSPEDGTQWCLSGEDGDGLGLLHTARSIVETLGYDMAVAPEGARNVTYNAFLLGGLTVGETTFDWNGAGYAYRTAATSDTGADFADISGLDGTFGNTAETQVQWCPARLSWNEGGSGKIVWFDVVPGLLYSISMDSGASRSALEAAAGQLFVPAQGDAG